jgi:uncharacterized protein (TIGR03067 family)
MRLALPPLAALCLALAPLPFPKQQPPDAASQGDLQAMQGVWAERFADSAAVTITGDRMEYSPDFAWKLTLNAKVNPRQIKAIGVGSEVAGKTRLGIYRLEGGKLIIGWRRQPAGKLDWPSSLDPIQKDVWVEVFTPVKP